MIPFIHMPVSSHTHSTETSLIYLYVRIKKRINFEKALCQISLLKISPLRNTVVMNKSNIDGAACPCEGNNT